MESCTPAAYGMYPHDASLQQVVRMLNQSGFDNEQICLMVWPRHHIASVMREANILNAERAAGAITVGLIGWLMKLGAVIIPTVGFFIRSRTFLHALVMRKDSPGLCGNSRALVALGFSEDDAERFEFENEPSDTAVLVYVACPEGAGTRTSRAVDVLRRTGAQECAALTTEDLAWKATA
ncbi:MAG: hypothetical protein WA718_12360 [Terriglobales bacterium]